MRTPEVEKLLAKAGTVPLTAREDRALAEEIERLEAEVAHAKRHAQCLSNAEHGLFAAIIFRLRPHFPAGSRDLEWDVLPGTLGALAKRAETAEARVQELEAENARLRAQSAPLAEQLAECGGYIASVRTDRQITWHEELYALQTVDWAEGALEIAEKANAALEAYDEALAEMKGTP